MYISHKCLATMTEDVEDTQSSALVIWGQVGQTDRGTTKAKRKNQQQCATFLGKPAGSPPEKEGMSPSTPWWTNGRKDCNPCVQHQYQQHGTRTHSSFLPFLFVPAPESSGCVQDCSLHQVKNGCRLLHNH